MVKETNIKGEKNNTISREKGGKMRLIKSGNEKNYVDRFTQPDLVVDVRRGN